MWSMWRASTTYGTRAIRSDRPRKAEGEVDMKYDTAYSQLRSANYFIEMQRHLENMDVDSNIVNALQALHATLLETLRILEEQEDTQ